MVCFLPTANWPVTFSTSCFGRLAEAANSAEGNTCYICSSVVQKIAAGSFGLFQSEFAEAANLFDRNIKSEQQGTWLMHRGLCVHVMRILEGRYE